MLRAPSGVLFYYKEKGIKVSSVRVPMIHSSLFRLQIAHKLWETNPTQLRFEGFVYTKVFVRSLYLRHAPRNAFQLTVYPFLISKKKELPVCGSSCVFILIRFLRCQHLLLHFSRSSRHPSALHNPL